MSLVKDLKKCNNIYQVIYADPPWNYRGQVQHGGAGKGYTSGANAFYPVLTIDALCKMGPTIKRLADPEGCILYLWYTPPIADDSKRLMKEWGFKYKTLAFNWIKKNDDTYEYDLAGNIIKVIPGKLMLNPGHYTMSSSELVDVGTIKRVPQPRGARNVKQVIFHPRTSHSAKPLEIRDRITEMHPTQKKIELFSRFDQKLVKDNWDDWGRDVGSVPWV